MAFLSEWPVVAITYGLELGAFWLVKKTGRSDTLDDSAQPLLPLAIAVGGAASLAKWWMDVSVPASFVSIVQMLLFVGAMIRRRDVSADVGLAIAAHLFVTLCAFGLDYTSLASWLALLVVVGVARRGQLDRAACVLLLYAQHVLPIVPRYSSALGSVGILGTLAMLVLRLRLFRQPSPVRLDAVAVPPIRRVALVLDGFCGPGAAVCGISRSVEAWVRELLRRDDVAISIYTAFDAHETWRYFGAPHRLSCYQLETTRIVYAKQPYFAPRLSFRNLGVAMRSLASDRPDAVHMLLDMPSQVLFHFAVNVTFAPIERPATVAVLHTCAESVFESSATAALGSMLVRCEQLGSFAFDQCATRSASFAERLRERFDFHFQYIVRPHVDKVVFSADPQPGDAALRAELTFGDRHPDALLVVYAGRIDPDKRILELILWCRRAGERVYLCVVGNGVLATHVAQMHGADNRIYCRPGFVTHLELARFYRVADVHASASLMETLGNTVLESVACGTPVLVPDAQGFRDTVHEDVTGLFVRSAEDAVGKLVRLRDDRAFRALLKENARAHSASLGVEDTVNELLAWYGRAKRQQLRAEMSRSVFGSALCHTLFTVYAGLLLTISIGIDAILVPWFKRYCERQDFSRDMAQRQERNVKPFGDDDD